MLIGNYYSQYKEALLEREDEPVLEFILKFPEVSYLEVGSGTGRFIKRLRGIIKINITCLEINEGLAEITRKDNFPTAIGSIEKTNFADGSFDIVHCSHLIEHFGYPAIVKVLNELARVTKSNGYIIIRSPLMHPDFYWDIDHVRPYPPNSILTFFTNQQQQSVGQYKIKEIFRWYRHSAMLMNAEKQSGFSWELNKALIFLWLKFGYPRSRKNGYVLIMQKL